jgi:hypothetical protein
MSGVVHVAWYATVFRNQSFGDAVAAVSPLSLRYGATRYQVHRDLDDRYKIRQMLWFENHDDWYRYWESPEMIEFRARYSGHYQIPIVYSWSDELASGELGPSVEQNGVAGNGGVPSPTPDLQPHAV